MRNAFTNVLLLCLFSSFIGLTSAADCAPADDDGTPLTGSSQDDEGFAVCKYQGAGACTYFPTDGSFSSGSSACPPGLPQGGGGGGGGDQSTTAPATNAPPPPPQSTAPQSTPPASTVVPPPTTPPASTPPPPTQTPSLTTSRTSQLGTSVISSIAATPSSDLPNTNGALPFACNSGLVVTAITLAGMVAGVMNLV